MNICGVILAGGRSSRMGKRKELLDWGGEPLISRLVGSVLGTGLPCLVVSNEPELLPTEIRDQPQVAIARDEMDSCGPISGIVTAFHLRKEAALLVMSCDLPFVDEVELTKLIEYGSGFDEWDGLIVEADGRLHPLLAIYRRSSQSVWEKAISSQDYRLMSVLNKLRMVRMPVGLLDPWVAFNANTPEEFEQALAERENRKALP